MTSGAIIVAEASFFFSMSVEFFSLDHKTKVNSIEICKVLQKKKTGKLLFDKKKVYF